MGQWTAEEIAQLDERWGNSPIPRIAADLGRSVNAVKLKAGRLGLGRHIHSGVYISLNQLAKAVGREYSIVANWTKYGLPVRGKKSLRKTYKVIFIEDFWEWAEKHKPLMQFDKIEPLVLGAEPAWVADARRADFEGKTTRAKWTSFEDENLVHMLNQYRFSIGEIASALNRTEGAVKRRIYDLGLRQRPVRQPNRRWTKSQINTMLDMLSRGYSFEQIGVQLGRTGSAVRGKYEQLNNPEYMKCYHRSKRCKYNGVEWKRQD